jgi:hypothetical protein
MFKAWVPTLVPQKKGKKNQKEGGERGRKEKSTEVMVFFLVHTGITWELKKD